MKSLLIACLAFACVLASAPPVHAQRAPEAGYIFPAGGKAGTTIDVTLGGYDWTPDMEFVVHDKRVQLVASGPPGPILIPPPPYWFGAKGRLASLPLPREVAAKLTIPANMPPGPIYWQAVNANGVSDARVFMVGDGVEVVEDEKRTGAQLLASLPVTVSGRLFKNEEVDRYRFTAAKDGPITCELTARRLGAKFNGVLQVHDAKGTPSADVLGQGGFDPCLTFAAKAGVEYVISVHDIDFGGDRSYVYRLAVTPGPHIVAAIPAACKRGESREIEFVIDTGAGKLASIKRMVACPAAGSSFNVRLDSAPSFALPLSDVPEVVGVPGAARPAGPVGITGVLDQADVEHRHAFAWKKGDVWSLALQARRLGSPLDVVLAILGPDGKEVARNDDLPGTTDAGLDFIVPIDGAYQVVVSDMAGRSGSRAAVYRLEVRAQAPDFRLQLAAPRASVPIAGKLDLNLQVNRLGGFKGPIALTLKGLPAGVTAPANLVIPGDKNALVIPLQADKDAGTGVGLVSIVGSADLASTGSGLFSRSGPPARPETTVSRQASARASVNLTPRSPDESQVEGLLVAVTMKPLFKGQPVDQDTGRKVHRGSTHPADIILERLNGFQGEIILKQAATQSYQVQGITGSDIVVPPGATKAIYPCFMPEWLETTRTSRMGIVAVAKAADPKGKVRWVCNDITGYVTMTMEGALLKVSAEEQDLTLPAGQPFDVHLKIARLTKLNEPVRLELKAPDGCKADPMVVGVKQELATIRVTPAATLRGLHTLVIRGTALQDGKYAAISEASVPVEFVPSVQAPKK